MDVNPTPAPSGLTRSVASYNLAGGAATPGWQGPAQSVPDWQYPGAGSGPASGADGVSGVSGVSGDGEAGGDGEGGEAGVGAELEVVGTGQPASLPANAGYTGYTVLSQGEMYHKVRKISEMVSGFFTSL